MTRTQRTQVLALEDLQLETVEEIRLLGWGRFQIEPDFSPEGAVDGDRVDERQAEGDDEPHQADL